MNLTNPVSTIMSRDLLTVDPDDTIAKLDNIFKHHRIHHVPVEQNGKLVGIVSKSDLLFFKRGFGDDKDLEQLEEIRLNNYEVKQIMTTKMARLEPEERINVALEIFKENIFHAIPIVKDDKLVGMLTTYDILKNLADEGLAVSEYKYV
ncbi:MAG: CBS domain-containing protein [Saprospiraceae bacterium]|nr:CBS domain-containing protein [Saprospiraceae bacterium]